MAKRVEVEELEYTREQEPAVEELPELFREAEELVLTLPPVEVRTPRHVRVALGHLNKQREKALARYEQAAAELKSLDAAI